MCRIPKFVNETIVINRRLEFRIAGGVRECLLPCVATFDTSIDTCWWYLFRWSDPDVDFIVNLDLMYASLGENQI